MRCFENWGYDGAALELHCSLADVAVAVQALGRRCSLVVVAAPVVVVAPFFYAPRRWPLSHIVTNYYRYLTLHAYMPCRAQLYCNVLEGI